jgi:hypothetical protein
MNLKAKMFEFINKINKINKFIMILINYNMVCTNN